MATDPGRAVPARPLIITATAPTPNGPLHLGHLSGPYLAADIAARTARARGLPVLAVSGLDPHQNYVLAKAEQEGRPPAALLAEYQANIREALRAARVHYDVFADPGAQPGYRGAVRRLLGELADHKAVVVDEVTLGSCPGCGRTMHHAYVAGRCRDCGAASSGGTCEGCGSFTTAANLAGARCAACGEPPEFRRAEAPLLRLESYRAALAELWSETVLTPRVRRLVTRYLAHGLPDVPLAYPTDWGIPAAGDGPSMPAGRHMRERIDVWAEMGLGLLAGVARCLDPAADSLDGYLAAWHRAGRCWHFLGIDNAFYFAVMFPALFIGAGLPAGWLGGLVVNEFYRLDGQKFSTSRDHAVWAHEFLAGEDPGDVRLFLSWTRPDHPEGDFTADGYSAFRDWIGPALRGGCAVPAALAPAEVTRAERALSLERFDPALALRCLLTAGTGRAPHLLAALRGEDPS